jgi:3-hydroxyisobutyrate dehydrogenase-like beta-hydroxyacid dehydrogenase
MQIGFLGLGTMGTPMAANLIAAGHAVRVWNRTKSKTTPLEAAGASTAATPAEAADGAEAVIGMLADDASTRAVFVDDGALGALPRDAVWVNMATVSVDFAREMAALSAERGIRYVAAPVMGRASVAEAAKLNILAAGAGTAIDRVQPLFVVLGQRTWRFGEEPERANVVKLAANFTLASAIEAMGEAAALVRGHDVAAPEFLEMLTTALFPAPAYLGYGGAIAREEYEPAGFKLELGAKDLRLALQAAEAVCVPMPVASVLRDSLLEGLAQGEGHLDWAALARVAARRAGQV